MTIQSASSYSVLNYQKHKFRCIKKDLFRKQYFLLIVESYIRISCHLFNTAEDFETINQVYYLSLINRNLDEYIDIVTTKGDPTGKSRIKI